MSKTSQPNQTSRFIGIAVLVAFAAVGCVGNASFTHLASGPGPNGTIAVLLWAILGMICAQTCVLSIWLVLGNESLWRRVSVVSLAIVTAASSWAFGSALTLDVNQSFGNQTEWEIVYILGLIPVAMLGLSIPLLAMRFFFSRQLALSANLPAVPVRKSHRFSIGQLLLVTTLIGIVGGGVEITKNLMNPQVNHWLVAGVVAAYSFGVGLLVLVPFVVGLLRQRHHYFWLFVVGVYVVLLAMATVPTLELLDSNGRRWFPKRINGLGAAVGLMIVFGGSSLIVFMTGLRLVGFRLVRISRRQLFGLR